MDDQGAGGSSRASDQNPHRRPLRESSLPPTLLPHLYHAPRHGSSPRIAPLIVPDWPNQSTRSRSQDHGRSLPSPSHLLRQTESTLDYDRVILSRSLDASPVNPAYVPNLNLPPPRIVLERSRPLVDHSAHSTRDRPMGGYPYPPVTRSTNTSPYEHQPRSYSHAPLYGHEPTSRTPQPLQPPPRRVGPSPGIRDVFMEEIGVLPQPEVPIRPLRDPHAELRHSPEFAQEQRRGRSEVRATHTSRTHRSQIQVQDYRVTYGQSHAEGSQRDLHRQMEPFPFQLIRGTYLVFSLSPNVQCAAFVALALVVPPSPFDPVISSPLFQMRSRWLTYHIAFLFYCPPSACYRETAVHRVPNKSS